jgi:predicted nucleic acid-binding protein
MSRAVSNTSPLLYLYRSQAIDLLGQLFDEVLVPNAVVQELLEGQSRGYDVPVPANYPWVSIIDPAHVPSEWFALDLGQGEIAAMALAFENPSLVLLLDDALARRIGEAAGLSVWGTLRVLIMAKQKGLAPEISPFLDQMRESGMWISAEIRERILRLAGESA